MAAQATSAITTTTHHAHGLPMFIVHEPGVLRRTNRLLSVNTAAHALLDLLLRIFPPDGDHLPACCQYNILRAKKHPFQWNGCFGFRFVTT